MWAWANYLTPLCSGSSRITCGYYLSLRTVGKWDNTHKTNKMPVMHEYMLLMLSLFLNYTVPPMCKDLEVCSMVPTFKTFFIQLGEWRYTRGVKVIKEQTCHTSESWAPVCEAGWERQDMELRAHPMCWVLSEKLGHQKAIPLSARVGKNTMKKERCSEEICSSGSWCWVER